MMHRDVALRSLIAPTRQKTELTMHLSGESIDDFLALAISGGEANGTDQWPVGS